MRLRKLLKTRSVIAILLLISSFGIQAQRLISREYQLKAVFLFNFIQYVEWPGDSFSSTQSPVVIGILGKNPFDSYLNETVSGEKVNGRSVTVQQYDKVEDIKTCHVLFINLLDTKKREQAITDLKGRNILTVSDATDFSKQGGMIRFFTKDNKIKFQINLEASKAADLVISSKLLRLAEIFESSNN